MPPPKSVTFRDILRFQEYIKQDSTSIPDQAYFRESLQRRTTTLYNALAHDHLLSALTTTPDTVLDSYAARAFQKFVDWYTSVRGPQS